LALTYYSSITPFAKEKRHAEVSPPRPLRGVTINDAIKRGDRRRAEGAAARGQALHKKQGNLAAVIGSLELALRKPGIDPRPLYGVPAHDAIKRKNAVEIQALLSQAKQASKDQRDLGKAIGRPRSRRQRQVGGATMATIRPYGAPISDAIKRGDTVKMKRLLVDAKKILKENEKLQKAVVKLEAALEKA
jgi:hypothetical protein